MKNIKLNHLQLKNGHLSFINGGYDIDIVIELDSDEILNYEQKKEIFREMFGNDEELLDDFSKENEFIEQRGKLLFILIDGESAPFTLEEAKRYDEMLG